MLIRLRIAWLNLLAVAGAVSALSPLLPTRRPKGHRAHLRRREPPVMVLTHRQRAAPP